MLTLGDKPRPTVREKGSGGPCLSQGGPATGAAGRRLWKDQRTPSTHQRAQPSLEAAPATCKWEDPGPMGLGLVFAEGWRVKAAFSLGTRQRADGPEAEARARGHV